MIAELMTSVPADAITHIHSAVSAHLSMTPMDTIPNPPPKDPGGKLSTSILDMVGYIKWGVLIAILVAAFLGAGLIAIGKVASHERSGRVGVMMVLGALFGAIVYSAIYGLLTMFVG